MSHPLSLSAYLSKYFPLKQAYIIICNCSIFRIDPLFNCVTFINLQYSRKKKYPGFLTSIRTLCKTFCIRNRSLINLFLCHMYLNLITTQTDVFYSFYCEFLIFWKKVFYELLHLTNFGIVLHRLQINSYANKC